MTHDEKMAYLNAVKAKKDLDPSQALQIHCVIMMVEFIEDPDASPKQARALLQELCARYGVKVEV